MLARNIENIQQFVILIFSLFYLLLIFLGDENCRIGYLVIARDGARLEKNKGDRDGILS